ncbi:MAG: tetratricopeptide repeat protein [Bacteroidales bacterium]|nr:tetratricopeptide repeat protein [Bacteroidales bacterium]
MKMFLSIVFQIILISNIFSSHYTDSIEKQLPALNEIQTIEAQKILSKEFSKSNFDKSLTYSKILISKAAKTQDRALEAEALSNIGDAHYYVSNIDSAFQYYEMSYSIANRIKNKPLQSNALNNLGIIYYLKGDFENAISKYNSSLQIAESINDLEGVANSFNNLANIFLAQGDIVQASNYYEKVLYIKKSTGNLQDYANCLINIGNTFEKTSEQNKALDNYIKALEIGNTLNETEIKAKAYQNIGLYYQNTDKKQKAFYYLDSAQQLYHKSKNSIGLSEILNNIGLLYFELGDFSKALEYYQNALKIQEKANNKQNISSTYFNIGSIYEEINDFKKAEEYYLMSLAINETLKDTVSIANVFNSLGIIYSNKQNYEKAVSYFYKAINLNESIDNNQGLALNIENLGTLMEESGKPLEALKLYEKSLVIEQENQNSFGIAQSFLNLGRVYKDLNKYETSLEYLQRCESISESKNYKKILMLSYKQISEVYNLQYFNSKNAKSLEEAHDYYIKYSKIKDTIYNEENSKQLSEIQTKIETIQKDKELELLKKDNLLTQTEKEKQQLFIYFLIFGILLFVILLLVLYNRYLVKNKANDLLEKQNKEITKQKHLIEIQSNDIYDSISSASRIQKALLPQAQEIPHTLREKCFVFYKPREIVSGDFYWFHHTEKLTYVVVADCTGHGVPGAFMSMLGISLLNEVVNMKELKHTNEILNFMRDRIISSLHQNEENEVKEGMDMSLISIDFENQRIEFSGANNSLLLIRKGEIIEHKADKMPVAFYYNMHPFTSTEIKYEKGDSIYLSTDGYQDQLGGPNYKKFMRKNYRNLLLSISQTSLVEQMFKLEQTLKEWQTDKDQVDDILIFGLKL